MLPKGFRHCKSSLDYGNRGVLRDIFSPLYYNRLPVLDVNGFNHGFSDSTNVAKAVDNAEEFSWAFLLGFAEKLVVGESENGENDVEELFAEQRLDHFDRQETRTFSQRYFVNKK